jgi:glucose/mannose-6-phosphate isomerase
MPSDANMILENGPHRLDIPATYANLDPTNIGSRFLSLPSQVEAGWDLGATFRDADAAKDVSRVLVIGMGGSGIGAELVRGLTDHHRDGIEVVPWREYELPAWASRDTLVVAVSVSGNTAETNTAFQQACERDIPGIAISGPGRLRAAAAGNSVLCANIDWDHEPRAALGFTFVTLYRALQELGLVHSISDDVPPAVSELSDVATQLAPEVSVDENVAKQIAMELDGRYPLIASVRPLLGVAARWKSQINENADCWAGWDQIPEMKHNTAQGIFQANNYPAQPCVVALKPDVCDEFASEDIDRILDELSANHVQNLLLEIEGPNTLGRMLVGSLLGDMVSYYMAILRERNPSATDSLNRVKIG